MISSRLNRLFAGVLIPSLLLSACATPTVVEVKTPQDNALSCGQLQQEIQRANQYRQDARNEDHFKISYIFILPAVYSIWQMSRAEDAAIQRGQYLQQIHHEKGCDRQPTGGFGGQGLGDGIPLVPNLPVPPAPFPSTPGMPQDIPSPSSYPYPANPGIVPSMPQENIPNGSGQYAPPPPYTPYSGGVLQQAPVPRAPATPPSPFLPEDDRGM